MAPKSDDEEKHNVEAEHISNRSSQGSSADQNGLVAVNAKLKNPLAGFSKAELMQDVEEFAREKDLEDILPLLKKGALVAQDPKKFEEIEELDETERNFLQMERTHRWHQPWMMYFMTSKYVCQDSSTY